MKLRDNSISQWSRSMAGTDDDFMARLAERGSLNFVSGGTRVQHYNVDDTAEEHVQQSDAELEGVALYDAKGLTTGHTMTANVSAALADQVDDPTDIKPRTRADGASIILCGIRLCFVKKPCCVCFCLCVF